MKSLNVTNVIIYVITVCFMSQFRFCDFLFSLFNFEAGGTTSWNGKGFLYFLQG